MSPTVFSAVLGAAVLHAAWNAAVKVKADRLTLLAIMMVCQAVLAIFLLPFVASPPPEAWIFILLSTVFHTGYFLFLIQAYKHGEFSHVYPIARGSAPLIIAIIATILLGETLNAQATLGIGLIAAGIMSLVLTRMQQGLQDTTALLYALGTGLFIASYSIVDGLGARASESSQSYLIWLNLFNGLPVVLVALVLRRGHLRQQVQSLWKYALFSGGISLLAYWMVLWAMTQAPLALVSAVRETSIIFALLIGVIFLKEKISLTKLAATAVTVVGAMVLRSSK